MWRRGICAAPFLKEGGSATGVLITDVSRWHCGDEVSLHPNVGHPTYNRRVPSRNFYLVTACMSALMLASDQWRQAATIDDAMRASAGGHAPSFGRWSM